MATKTFGSVDEYMDCFSGETRKRLDMLRQTIKRLLPEADERISYNIPGYFSGKKMVVYFAGYPNHVSLYPIQGEAQEKLMEAFSSGKATAKFLHKNGLPIELIEKFVLLRAD